MHSTTSGSGATISLVKLIFIDKILGINILSILLPKNIYLQNSHLLKKYQYKNSQLNESVTVRHQHASTSVTKFSSFCVFIKLLWGEILAKCILQMLLDTDCGFSGRRKWGKATREIGPI